MKRFVPAVLCAGLLGMLVPDAMANPKLEFISRENAVSRSSDMMQKVDYKLLQVRAETLKGTRSLVAAQKYVPWSIRDNKLQVLVGSSDLQQTARAAQASGMEVVDTYENFGFRFATIRTDDIRKLDGLVGDGTVLSVTPEIYMYTSSYDPIYGKLTPDQPNLKKLDGNKSTTKRVGDADNQAYTALRADDANSNFGVTGSGIRVGVLSDSIFDTRLGGGSGSEPGFFTGTTDQNSGDLPASLYVVEDLGGGGSDEGNGMAQLIYDIAPSADISFATAFGGISGFASNITSLWSNGSAPADIIVDDVGYASNPVYQDGLIAIAYEDAVTNGVPCFSSAGNNTNNGHEAAFSDISGTDDLAFPPSGNDLHDFGGGDTHLQITLANLAAIRVGLVWNEPYLTANNRGRGAGSEADLDLYLVSNTTTPLTNPGNVLASSFNVQGTSGSPAGDPYEFLTYQNTTGSAQTVYVVIEQYDDTVDPSSMLLFVDPVQGTVTINDSALLGDRTVSGHNSAANVMACAAMLYYEWDVASIGFPTGDSDGDIESPSGQFDVESFSSLGANQTIYFDEDGISITPVTRAKPDITCLDGTDTTFFGSGDFDSSGFPNFFGTSAAAPNAAAVAALVMERYKTLNSGSEPTPAEVYSLLKTTAFKDKGGLDVETGAYNFLSGEGVVDAQAAVAAVVSADPAPSVDSINRADSSPTNASVVNFTVTFDESVTGVSASNFSVDAVGAQSGASIGTVSGSGTTWNVPVNTVDDADGFLSIDLDNITGIQDSGSNALTGTFTGGQTYDVDRLDPSVSSIVRDTSSPTNGTGGQVTFTVAFSEPVFDVMTTDFTIDGSGDQTGATINSVSGSGASRQVTVDIAAGEGNLSIDATGGTVRDDVNNLQSVSFTSGESYLVDTVAPDTSATGPTGTVNQSGSVFQIAFSESTTGAAFTGVELYYTYTGMRGTPMLYPGGPYTTSPINFDISTASGSGNYEFYTVGFDAVGNEETPPGAADITPTLNDISNVADWMILD